MAKRRLVLGALVAAVAFALAGMATATPGSGIAAVVVARAAFADRVDLKVRIDGDDPGRDNIHVPGARDTVMQQIDFSPNGHSGWHTHPGPAVALIQSGELTLYSVENGVCASQTYSAGQAFVDSGRGHVHLAHNPSQTQHTFVWVTYFDVPPESGVRLDADAPASCTF